jgi:hypothetical protein
VAKGNHEKTVRIKVSCDGRKVLESCSVDDESLVDVKLSQWKLFAGMLCSVVLFTVTF